MTTAKRPARSTGIPFSRVTITAQIVTALIVGTFMFASAGVQLPLLTHHYTITATVPDAAGLDPADRPTVTIAGVKAGSLKAVRYEPANGQARLELQLDENVKGKLFADASVRVSPRSALQDLVVDIDPGDPHAGPLREDRITRSAPTPVGADQVFSVLDADTRAYTQVLLDTLRQMTDGREGPLKTALRELPDTTDAVGKVSRQLAQRRHVLTQLVAELNTISQTTGRRGDQLAHAITQAERALTVTATQRQALSASIRALPDVLTQATGAFASLRALAQPLVPAATRLRPAARALPATLRQTRTLLPHMNHTINTLDELIVDGRAPLRSLTGAVRTLGPVTRDLQDTVPLVNAAVNSVTENKKIITEMLGFWPSTMSTANDLSILTRATFFRVLPIKPGAVGLPDGSTTATGSLKSAERQLRDARPELFSRPRSQGDINVALGVIQALVADRCRREQAAACQLLARLYAKPPRLLAR